MTPYLNETSNTYLPIPLNSGFREQRSHQEIADDIEKERDELEKIVRTYLGMKHGNDGEKPRGKEIVIEHATQQSPSPRAEIEEEREHQNRE